MKPKIQTHRTAIKRNKPSRPLRYLYDNHDDQFHNGTVLDYGCGRGDDVDFLLEMGCDTDRYDPNFSPTLPKRKYDVIVCTYVMCVIPDPEERHKILLKMWDLLKPGGIIYISTRKYREVNSNARRRFWTKYKDGWLTRNNTFQKGFKQEDIYRLGERLGTKSWSVTNIKVSSPKGFALLKLEKINNED